MNKILLCVSLVLVCVSCVSAIDNIIAGDDLTITFIYNNGSKVSGGECDLNLYNSSGAWNQILTNQDMNEISSSGIYNYTIPDTWETVRYTGRASCNKSITRAGTEIDFYVIQQDYDEALHTLTANATTLWETNVSTFSNTASAGYKIFNLAKLVWEYTTRTVTGGNITAIDYVEFIEFIEYIETLG